MPRSKRRPRTSVFGHIVFVLSLLSVAASGALLWGGYRYFREEFPDVAILRNRYPVVRYNGPKKPWVVVMERSRPASWADLPQISKVAVGAIIVSEDWAFYQHDGYDAGQIKEALKQDWEKGHFARGASTITQQVVKNVFLEKDKNLWRKLKELYLAIRLEDSVGKRRILETYLNIAEWGEGIFGIRAASQFYFHKAPSELTAKEGAFLAMLLPSPKKYSQSFRSKELTAYARRTINSILAKMEKANYLSDEQRVSAVMTPLAFEAVVTTEENAPVGTEETAPPDDDAAQAPSEDIPPKLPGI